MFSWLIPFRRLLEGKKIKKYLLRFRGQEKDPFSCLKIISLVLFVSFFLIFFFKTLPAKESYFFAESFSKEFPEFLSNQPFLNPAERILLDFPDFILIEENSLKASLPPFLVSSQILGALSGEEETKETRKEIQEYIVKEEDTLASLAKKFGISLKSLLWANDLTEKSIIKAGQKLIIPPVSGVIYHVKRGDTLSEIAKTYRGKIEEIVAFNELANENDIYIGDILIIPNGVIPPKPKPSLSSSISSLPLTESQFISPVSSPYIITQGLHWYNAVDLSHPGNACGRPVFAVAGGTVQKAGYHRVSGNHIKILHPNGVVTFYGHLSKIVVKPNQTVNVGQIIGYIGTTGVSTGCHLHFEVRGARNPFIK